MGEEGLILHEVLMKPWSCQSISGRFLQYYRCQLFPENQRSQLDNTNKVVMPLSAIGVLTSHDVDFPLMFSVHNPFHGCRPCHCGVLEFTAEEGFVHMPRWMMEKLGLEQGDLVFFENTSLPKATFVKLQPHATEFIRLPDPKAVLERRLNEYSCLTAGDTISIPHDDKVFLINIVETQPGSAVSTVDTNCEVDFEQPLDYVEPEKVEEESKTTKAEEEEKNKFVPFKGLGRRLGWTVSSNGADDAVKDVVVVDDSCKRQKPGKPVFGGNTNTNEANSVNKEEIRNVPEKKVQRMKIGEEENEEKNKFVPFQGFARRLDSTPDDYHGDTEVSREEEEEEPEGVCMDEEKPAEETEELEVSELFGEGEEENEMFDAEEEELELFEGEEDDDDVNASQEKMKSEGETGGRRSIFRKLFECFITLGQLFLESLDVLWKHVTGGNSK